MSFSGQYNIMLSHILRDADFLDDVLLL